jgi:hypothetical protein
MRKDQEDMKNTMTKITWQRTHISSSTKLISLQKNNKVLKIKSYILKLLTNRKLNNFSLSNFSFSIKNIYTRSFEQNS